MKTLPIITWILILCLSGFIRGHAQSITLTFSGIKDGQAIALDRIEIQNLDKGCDTNLYHPNSSLTLQPMGIGDMLSDTDWFTLFQNVPNPAGVRQSIRIISGPHSVNRSCLLSYTGTASMTETLKSTLPAGGFIFSLGDHLRFTGHSNTLSSVIEDTPQSN